MSQVIRVFLADDHDIVLEGARRLLSSDERFTVVGVATDGAEVLNAPLDACDVLMLDLSLPRYSGLEVLRRVRARYADLRIVVFSMYPREQYEARARDAGADAYVVKNTRSDEQRQASHLERVIDLWQQRVQWWEQEFDYRPADEIKLVFSGKDYFEVLEQIIQRHLIAGKVVEEFAFAKNSLAAAT